MLEAGLHFNTPLISAQQSSQLCAVQNRLSSTEEKHCSFERLQFQLRYAIIKSESHRAGALISGCHFSVYISTSINET